MEDRSSLQLDKLRLENDFVSITDKQLELCNFDFELLLGRGVYRSVLAFVFNRPVQITLI